MRKLLPVLVAVGFALCTGVAQADPPPTITAGPATADGTAPVEPLAVDCSKSQLPPHTGFQIAPACVKIAFGEVAAANDDPALLITDAPHKIHQGRPFTITVSSRNLVRDRFLGAAVGGYYAESAVLADGITRGHFHVGCRPLGSDQVAPEPVRSTVFQAVEDGKGGRDPDSVAVTFPGVFSKGQLVQCAAWSGDGSHRMPMMQFANQIPAFDTVRIRVVGGGEGE